MDELIKMVIKTLGTIDVRGEENMRKILGCMDALRSILKPEEKEADNG